MDLELVEPSEHVDAISKLQAGTLDIAVTETMHLVEDQGKGHAVVGSRVPLKCMDMTYGRHRPMLDAYGYEYFRPLIW